jgi:hypothetical protein
LVQVCANVFSYVVQHLRRSLENHRASTGRRGPLVQEKTLQMRENREPESKIAKVPRLVSL